MFENFTYDDAFRFVKHAFKLAFGFAPRRPDVYFTYVEFPYLDFNIGGRSYSLILGESITEFSHERDYYLAIHDVCGRGHDEYFSFSEPYKTRI